MYILPVNNWKKNPKLIGRKKNRRKCTDPLRPVETRELAPAARSRNKAPSPAAPTISSEKICTTKLLLPSFKLVWYEREQASGANLLHESVSGASSLVCTEICLSWTDLSPVGQSNWLILSFRAVHRHVGVLTRKQVSGASSLVCTGLYSVMQIMTAKSTLGTLYAHVVLHSAIFPQILCIVLYAAHVLPIKFFSNYYFNKLFRATAKCDKNRWITRVNSTSTGINGVRLAHHIS